MRIIPYEASYRDDMIFMVLEAKNALGRVPTLNEDLLDIQKNYLDQGDMFWLALDVNNRVIGCIGYRSMEAGEGIRLHRLYVKCSRKRQGIGTALLHTAQTYAAGKGKTVVYVHLGEPNSYYESYSFYPKHGYEFIGPDQVMKRL